MERVWFRVLGCVGQSNLLYGFAGSLRWEKWLRQQLPPLTLGTCSSVPGLRSSKDDNIIAPARTVEWPNFWPDVDRYLELAANKHSHHKRIDIEESIKYRRLTSEADCMSVYDLLLTKIGGTLFGDKFTLELQKSSRRQHSTTNRPGALNNPSANVNNAMRIATRTIYPDMLLKYENRGIVVVEMKKPSFFRTRIENSIPDLFKAYGERGNPFSDVQRYLVLAQSVEQLFMYLYDCGIGYGIISSADLSYFLRRVGDTLYISQGVEWQNPKFVAALSYFLEEARDNPVHAFGEGKWPAYCVPIYLLLRSNLFVIAFQFYFLFVHLLLFDNVLWFMCSVETCCRL